jgi:hypothetical protein
MSCIDGCAAGPTAAPSYRRYVRVSGNARSISSKGFIDIFTLSVSTPLPSDLTRIITLKSTTRLTGTSIRMKGVSTSLYALLALFRHASDPMAIPLNDTQTYGRNCD